MAMDCTCETELLDIQHEPHNYPYRLAIYVIWKELKYILQTILGHQVPGIEGQEAFVPQYFYRYFVSQIPLQSLYWYNFCESQFWNIILIQTLCFIMYCCIVSLLELFGVNLMSPNGQNGDSIRGYFIVYVTRYCGTCENNWWSLLFHY